MLGTQLVVVSDAHLGAADDDDAFTAFLDAVPSLGDCLLVNGDLFDFWFSYRRVIPRAGFRVAAGLAALRRRIPIVMTGGNHDRWGDSFWQRDANIIYSTGDVRFRLGEIEVLAVHGDGIAEEHRRSAVMHRITRHPATAWLYRLLHPDFGIWLVDKLSRHLADSTRDPSVLDRAQARQQLWARQRLEGDPSIGLLVMSHTHRPAVAEPFPGRRYLNPGAWIDGRRYAIVGPAGIELRQFGVAPATA
jgi:UDP-2,3-diacylglucosamine hydrolase